MIANTGTATQNNMADVYLIETQFDSHIVFEDYIKSHLLFMEDQSTSKHIHTKNGEIIGVICQIMKYTLMMVLQQITEIQF